MYHSAYLHPKYREELPSEKLNRKGPSYSIKVLYLLDSFFILFFSFLLELWLEMLVLFILLLLLHCEACILVPWRGMEPSSPLVLEAWSLPIQESLGKSQPSSFYPPCLLMVSGPQRCSFALDSSLQLLLYAMKWNTDIISSAIAHFSLTLTWLQVPWASPMRGQKTRLMCHLYSHGTWVSAWYSKCSINALLIQAHLFMLPNCP